MREIKFRAWDKSVPTYAEVMDELEASGCMVNWEYVKESSYLRDAIDGKYPLMQYTGLKDKNGVEIYEGDIVTSENKNYKVVYDGYMFNLEGFYNSSFDYPTVAFSEVSCVVIGNIYKNEELLNNNIDNKIKDMRDRFYKKDELLECLTFESVEKNTNIIEGPSLHDLHEMLFSPKIKY